MIGIAIAAAIGAVFGALTTASLKWGKWILNAVMTRVQPDHRTLSGWPLTCDNRHQTAIWEAERLYKEHCETLKTETAKKGKKK